MNKTCLAMLRESWITPAGTKVTKDISKIKCSSVTKPNAPKVREGEGNTVAYQLDSVRGTNACWYARVCGSITHLHIM